MELLILVLVGAIIVTSFADKRGMQPALIIILVAQGYLVLAPSSS